MLGWVSFFTDTASEMVYPLLPLFLTRVLGAGRDVARRHRGRRRSGQQHPQDHLRPDGGSDGRAEAAGARRLRPVVGRCGRSSRWRADGCRSSRCGSPIGSARASAPRRAMRCSRRSRTSPTAGRSSASIAAWITPARSWARSRRGLSLLPPRRLPHALRADHRARASSWSLILLRVPRHATRRPSAAPSAPRIAARPPRPREHQRDCRARSSRRWR